MGSEVVSDWEEMLIISDAMQVDLETKYGGIKQTTSAQFKIPGLPFDYEVKLVIGHCSVDYETAAVVFHIAKELFLLVEKNGKILDFTALSVPSGDSHKLMPDRKTPVGVKKAAKPFVVKHLGMRGSA